MSSLPSWLFWPYTVDIPAKQENHLNPVNALSAWLIKYPSKARFPQADFCPCCASPCWHPKTYWTVTTLTWASRDKCHGSEGDIKSNLYSCLFQPVPYICNIPGGLKANRTITVRGTIPKNAKRSWLSFSAYILGLGQRNGTVTIVPTVLL